MSTIGSDFLKNICDQNPQYDNIYNFIENIIRMSFILDGIEDLTNIKFENVYQNIIQGIEVLKTQKKIAKTSDISIIISSIYTCTLNYTGELKFNKILQYMENEFTSDKIDDFSSDDIRDLERILMDEDD